MSEMLDETPYCNHLGTTEETSQDVFGFVLMAGWLARSLARRALQCGPRRLMRFISGCGSSLASFAEMDDARVILLSPPGSLQHCSGRLLFYPTMSLVIK